MKKILAFVTLLALTVGAMADELPKYISIEGSEITVYDKGSAKAIVNCTVNRIFIDHRKFGFFQIRLFPILVAQGVQIQVESTNLDQSWFSDLEANIVPQVVRHAIEWRDVTISAKDPDQLQLHAGTLRLANNGGKPVCALENAKFTSKDRIIEFYKAELTMDKNRLSVRGHDKTKMWHEVNFTSLALTNLTK